MLEDDYPQQFLEYTDISKGRFDKFITEFVDTLGMYAGFRRYLYAGNIFPFWNIVHRGYYGSFLLLSNVSYKYNFLQVHIYQGVCTRSPFL